VAKPTNTLHNGPGRLSKDAAIRSRLAIFAGLLASIAIPRAIAAQETQQFVSGEVDFGQLDEDAYVTPRVDYGLRVWKDDPRCVDPACDVAFDMLLSAPVRLRVIDAQPADAGVLREEDWDEPSDYARIVRHVEYGNPNGPLHARLGELGPLVIGHGSIMNSYFNVVTPDVYEAGLHLNANTRYGGLQLMLDDVLQPTVFGIRGYVRPWGQAAANPWTRLSIGVSAVATSAPRRRCRRGAMARSRSTRETTRGWPPRSRSPSPEPTWDSCSSTRMCSTCCRTSTSPWAEVPGYTPAPRSASARPTD